MMAEILHYFPEEILDEILLRLPSKSLCHYRSVCKAWYKLITSHAFISSHLNQNMHTESRNYMFIRAFTIDEETVLTEEFSFYPSQKIVTGGVGKSLRTPVVKLVNKGAAVRSKTIIGSCNGLLCMMSFDFDIFLFNPSIQKLIKLPPCGKETCFLRWGMKMDWKVFGFGVNVSNGDFKVIRICGVINSSFWPLVFAEVYSLTTRKWVEIDGVYDHLVDLKSSQVYLNGSSHWIGTTKVENEIVCGLVSFDLSEEVFQGTSVPNQLTHCMGTAKLVTMPLREKECLAIITNETKGSFHIWVMEEYGVLESWTSLYNIDTELMDALDFAGFGKNGIFFMAYGTTQLACYDPQTKLVSDLSVRGYCHHVKKYVESLVLLEAGLNI